MPKPRSWKLNEFEQQILGTCKEYPSEKLDDGFDMKSRVCECIISCEMPGGNTFKLPHRSKKSR